jgi:3-methyladenine DNA glycosylase AlkD
MIQIKALPLFAMWCISFVAMAITAAEIQDLDTTAGKIFWIAFALFAFTVCYMNKHKERISIEIDELLGE